MLILVADYMYPHYDPFEETGFDYETYEDADEALALLDRIPQRKRYMIGLFPGVNEFFLQRDAIREVLLPISTPRGLTRLNVAFEHFVITKHKCLDGPDLAPSDVRCCPYWYRCEKPDAADGAQGVETTRILILNLNYSIARDEGKRVTVIYDSERLKPTLWELGSKKMSIFCPINFQDYPYAVVDFPTVPQSRAAFEKLNGQCLGYSGRHLRVQYVSPYDYTLGGRHAASENTREILVVPLEPEREQRRPPKTPKRTPGKSPDQVISPPKSRNTRMLVTKHGRRIQMPQNLVSRTFCWRRVVR